MTIELNKMAIKHVGDGQKPNLFFVTCSGNTILITSESDIAYKTWQKLPHNEETTLEDRLNGVVASCEKEHDDNDKWTGKYWVNDDFSRFIK